MKKHILTVAGNLFGDGCYDEIGKKKNGDETRKGYRTGVVAAEIELSKVIVVRQQPFDCF